MKCTIEDLGRDIADCRLEELRLLGHMPECAYHALGPKLYCRDKKRRIPR